MPIDRDAIRQIANDNTAAWNSGPAEAVAAFYAPDGRIILNRGTPWEGARRRGRHGGRLFR